VRFHRLKRKRLNDGFEGPDISLNAEMTHEQIEVAFKVTEIAKTVTKARRLACATPARLNLVENEAVRIRLEVAEAVLWVDPRTYQ
jgi:hypothetical protein